MITEANFKSVLLSLGFSGSGELYEKKFPHFGVSMRVDFSDPHKKLCYPDAIRGRERNDGFDAPENFVVFECVNRLLEKGYRPEHIELEKEWHLGHDAKGGRADICVTDEEGSMLFIVECKTWGREFDKALSDTKNDGGQLFSYWQQEQSCKWLVLYASDFRNGAVEYKAPVIDCADDANIVRLARKDKSIKLYRDAHTAPEKHEVWKETYSGQFHDDLIFSEASVAYQIGVPPLLKKDLRDFTPDDKIVNRFEEILRHNNVSDKENAFNRLVALFICKLVDESTKDETDEVEFQYKQGTDTYETLQDRLQRLHRDGMEKFMREEIYYVSADYPERLFLNYTGQKRKKAIEDLQNTIRILKFYSNNDFAFKDVHNEELFYQNGKILVEMVQLFEKYRIVYPSKHQFLGDLFEQLLNKGFKQNEGQFFTPMPITRFIWDSLPVDRMVRSERGTVYPKVIDYACGAGHFLTEAVETVNYFARSDGNNAWVKDRIYGIEKDYRLARVAKISLFMNGAGEGNIIFGDGLENAPDKGIDNGSFDILVANPPYSVKDFKQHLQLKNNSFTLLDRVGLNGSEIETLFVERIAQLLKPRGIAAVILPSSILSNDSASYTGAREQLLQNFHIRGIAAFGSKTFGATGTNTVVMFLEKFNEPPKQIDLASDSVDAILSGAGLEEWKDKEILEEYLAQIGLDGEVYGRFLKKDCSLRELKTVDYFNMYVDAFADSADAKSLQRTRAFKSKSADQQAAAYLERFYEYARAVEREKLLYFSLVYRQKTVIITAPADNREQKDFLGYDWSNRKGNEGIQIITPGGKMYDAADRTAEGTLANAIKRSFLGVLPSFTEEQRAWGAVVGTKDMLDFSRPGFNKAMRLSVESLTQVNSRYPVLPLGQICEVTIGGTPSRRNPEYFTGDHLWVSIAEMQGQTITDTKEKITDEAIAVSNVKRIPAGTTLLSFKLSIGKTAIAGTELYTNEAIAALIPLDRGEILDRYLFYLFKGKLIDLERTGSKAFGKSLNSAYLREEVKIPVPPVAVQQQIVDACAEIDAEYEATRMSVETYKRKIEELFAELDVIMSTGGGYRLSELFEWVTTRISALSLSPDTYVTTDTMLQKCAGIREYTQPLPDTNVTAFQEGDILLSNIRPYLQKLWLATFSGGCSNDVLVLRVKDRKDHDPAFYASCLKRQAFFDHIMRDVSGVKMPRGKKTHIMNYRVPNVDLRRQKETAAKVEAIEKQILEANEKLEALSGKTAEILDRFLHGPA